MRRLNIGMWNDNDDDCSIPLLRSSLFLKKKTERKIGRVAVVAAKEKKKHTHTQSAYA